MKLNNFIAIVSDFDDTILDNKPNSNGQGLHERSRLEALRHVGKKYNLPDLVALPPQINAVAFHYTPVYSLEGAFWWLLGQAGVVPKGAAYDPAHPLIAELIAAKFSAYQRLLATEAAEVPGARDFFRQAATGGLAGRLGIASAGHRAHIATFLEAHGMSPYFLSDHIITKEDVTHPKPHVESFQKSLQAMGIMPSDYSRVLAFEDDPRGIVAAKKLGLYTCGLATTFTANYLMAQAMPPDIVADDFIAYAQIFGLC